MVTIDVSLQYIMPDPIAFMTNWYSCSPLCDNERLDIRLNLKKRFHQPGKYEAFYFQEETLMLLNSCSLIHATTVLVTPVDVTIRTTVLTLCDGWVIVLTWSSEMDVSACWFLSLISAVLRLLHALWNSSLAFITLSYFFAHGFWACNRKL